MATTYSYDDTYIINSVDDTDLEASETKALTDLGKQGIVDEFYLKEMTLCLVYIDLAIKQGESEAMNERVTHYRKEYNRYSMMNLHGANDEKVYSVEIGRG